MRKNSKKQLRRRHSKKLSKGSKRKRKNESFLYEALEPRRVLNAVPLVNHDLDYVTALNTVLTVTNANEGVIDNDFDAENSSLSATKIDDPTNGSITLNSNGTFTYTPATGFEGVDTFTYQVNDGTDNSALGTVQVTVGNGLSGQLNSDEFNSGSLLHDGVLSLTQPLGGGLDLVYRSDTTPVVLVPIETMLTSGTTIPDSVTANLTIDGVSSGNVTFDNTGLATGEPLRFVLRSLTTASTTGMYDWSVTATLNYTSSTLTRTFTGSLAIVNRTGSEFGIGWWLDGLDRLHTSSEGALLVNGDGTTLWFEKDGGTYLQAENDPSFGSLVQNGGGDYTFTDKWGDQQNFDSNGYVTDIQKLNNTNASFTFEYDASDRIEKIVDEFGREYTFSYNGTTGKLDSVNDFFGRDSTLTFLTDELTSVKVADEIATGYTAPTWSFEYTTIGGKKFLNKHNDPDQNTTEYIYNAESRRIQQINNADHTTQDESKWQVFPTISEGFAYASSGNTLLKVANMDARYIDEVGNEVGFTTDRFANTTSLTDALNETSVFEYDNQGWLYRSTAPDPDSTGPLTAPVIKYGYSNLGDVAITVYPDGTTTTETYDATHHSLASFTNKLGFTESYSYFSDGDLQTFTDIDGNVWTYTYDTHGNLLTEVSPDPDGMGTLYSSITTTYTYDLTYYNRLTRTTWDNNDYQDFTYTASDQVATFIDELGNVTSHEYDPLDRLTKTTLPDPDGAGSQTSPVYTYEYGSNLLIDKEIDALGNATEYEYDARNWLTKIVFPDPDGAGTLTSPEMIYDYDKTGMLTSEIHPEFNGVSITYQYDANGQLTTKSGPVANQDHNYIYDAMGRTIEETDASGRTVNYEYDLDSQLTKTIDHDPDGAGPEIGPTTEFEYNDTGQLTKVIDALGRETTYAYLDNGLLESLTNPDPDSSGPDVSAVTSYQYDNIGRLNKITDPAERISEKEYDIFGRLTRFVNPDPDGPGSLQPTDVEYVYSQIGLLTSVINELGFVTTYAYDNLGRMTSKTLPDPDGAGSKTSPVYGYS